MAVTSTDLRESNLARPEAERLAEHVRVYRTFPGAQLRHHGALTRYGLILLARFVRLSDSFVWSISSLDDAMALPAIRRRLGSGVALLAKRRDTETLGFS